MKHPLRLQDRNFWSDQEARRYWRGFYRLARHFFSPPVARFAVRARQARYREMDIFRSRMRG